MVVVLVHFIGEQVNVGSYARCLSFGHCEWQVPVLFPPVNELVVAQVIVEEKRVSYQLPHIDHGPVNHLEFGLLANRVLEACVVGVSRPLLLIVISDSKIWTVLALVLSWMHYLCKPLLRLLNLFRELLVPVNVGSIHRNRELSEVKIVLLFGSLVPWLLLLCHLLPIPLPLLYKLVPLWLERELFALILSR